MNTNAISLVILVIAVLYMIYRRGRALLTRQKIKPTSMLVRIGIFLVLGVVVLIFALGDSLTLGGAILGLILGVGIAWIGLRLTLIETLPDGTYYTANKYIGLAVFAVFLLRFVYKIAESITTVSALQAQPGGLRGAANPLSQIGGDPLTTGAYFLLIGYYVCYYAVLLLRFRTPPAQP
jgi:hypothetical protein